MFSVFFLLSLVFFLLFLFSHILFQCSMFNSKSGLLININKFSSFYFNINSAFISTCHLYQSLTHTHSSFTARKARTYTHIHTRVCVSFCMRRNYGRAIPRIADSSWLIVCCVPLWRFTRLLRLLLSGVGVWETRTSGFVCPSVRLTVMQWPLCGVGKCALQLISTIMDKMVYGSSNVIQFSVVDEPLYCYGT